MRPEASGEAGGGRGPVVSRVVLVTGGSRGIGAACASWFVSRGHRVAVTSRAGTGPEGALALSCDVADPGAVDRAFAAVEERWGPVEVLVASAGVTADALVLRMSTQQWSSVLDTNLTGAFLCAKRAMGKMVRARWGRLVFVSSAGAYLGVPGQANYAASKAGLVGMTRAMAREVGGRGITANVVAPGVIRTDMTAVLGEDRVAALASMAPVGRAGEPEEVAAAVGFLASDEAGYLTGAVVPVDGGLGMGL